jgi:hypothetical protein
MAMLTPPPSAILENRDAEASPGHLQQDPKAVASQRYFKSVTILIDELKQQKAPNYNKLAYWLYQYSQKIDNLPMLNVDPELMSYGASVSAALRGLSEVAKGTLYRQKHAYNQAGEQLVSHLFSVEKKWDTNYPAYYRYESRRGHAQRPRHRLVIDLSSRFQHDRQTGIDCHELVHEP